MDIPDHLLLFGKLNEHRDRVAREIASQHQTVVLTRVAIAESRDLMARIDAQLDGEKAWYGRRSDGDADAAILL